MILLEKILCKICIRIVLNFLYLFEISRYLPSNLSNNENENDCGMEHKYLGLNVASLPDLLHGTAEEK